MLLRIADKVYILCSHAHDEHGDDVGNQYDDVDEEDDGVQV